MSEATNYEASFNYTKGALAVTSHVWQDAAWQHLRKNACKNVQLLTRNDTKILVVGLGDGGILPLLKWEKQKIIGLDINREFLKEAKQYCEPIVASAANLPFKETTIDTVFFELVLHHLKGQMRLDIPLKEAYRTLKGNGKLLAIEPNALNPSGLLLNLINKFHLYARLFGGSNYEYALTPKEIAKALSDFDAFSIVALSFLHPRFPLALQRIIAKNEKLLMLACSSFAWIFLAKGIKK